MNKVKRIKKSYKTKKKRDITVYDKADTTAFINKNRPLKLKNLGLMLPDNPTTQVISIRLPTYLLNEIRAIGSQQDIPYQALIKLFLSEMILKNKNKAKALR